MNQYFRTAPSAVYVIHQEKEVKVLVVLVTVPGMKIVEERGLAHRGRSLSELRYSDHTPAVLSLPLTHPACRRG